MLRTAKARENGLMAGPRVEVRFGDNMPPGSKDRIHVEGAAAGRRQGGQDRCQGFIASESTERFEAEKFLPFGELVRGDLA